MFQFVQTIAYFDELHDKLALKLEKNYTAHCVLFECSEWDIESMLYTNERFCYRTNVNPILFLPDHTH